MVNQLFYCDNLDVLRRHIKSDSVDLVYLDPPFKSNQDYNVLFAEKDGTRAASQFKAFEDTWEWNIESLRLFEELVENGGRVSDVMQAFRRFLGTNDTLLTKSLNLRVHTTGRQEARVSCCVPRLGFKNGDAGDRLQREEPRIIHFCLGSLMLQEHAISRYLSRLFDSLPSPFAQLAFLASLRDPYTGHYLHEGWATVCSPAEVNVTLRDAHQSVFASVAGLSLVELSRELRNHFRSTSEVERSAATLWLDTKPYYEMIPEGCSSLSRKYFISQVHFALELLVHAPSWEYLEEPASSLPKPPAPTLRPQLVN